MTTQMTKPNHYKFRLEYYTKTGPFFGDLIMWKNGSIAYLNCIEFIRNNSSFSYRSSYSTKSNTWKQNGTHLQCTS